jgi:flagellar M-ring protein FliF
MSVANALPGAAQAGGGDTSKSTSGSTEETTNYEINKTITTSSNDSGNLKRLSVAVVVDSDGTKARSPAEMAQIEALVKSAMGFDASRGDQLQVKNMAFARLDTGDATPAPKPLLGLDSAYWFKIIEAAILCLTALLIGLFVVRPLIHRMFAAQNGVAPGALGASPVAGALPAPPAAAAAATPALPAPGANGAATARPAGAAEGEAPLVALPRGGIDLSQIEGGFGENSIKKVGEVVSAHPEEALSIIRTWLHQPA